jgi:hypothetical protein
MESTRSDSILFRDLIPSLSDSASSVLEKKLDSLIADRTLQAKRQRKISIVSPAAPAPPAAAAVPSAYRSSQTFFESLKGGSLSVHPAFQSSSFSATHCNSDSLEHKTPLPMPMPIPMAMTMTQTKKPSLGLRQSTVAMLDHPKLDELEHLTIAAKKIQNVARGNRDRTLATQRREDLMNARAEIALAQHEFVSMASEVLCDTMFNLMQEALYGEFVIDAEPIKFLMKGGGGGGGGGGIEEEK